MQPTSGAFARCATQYRIACLLCASRPSQVLVARLIVGVVLGPVVEAVLRVAFAALHLRRGFRIALIQKAALGTRRVFPRLLLGEPAVPLEQRALGSLGVDGRHVQRREGSLALVPDGTCHLPDGSSPRDVSRHIPPHALLAHDVGRIGAGAQVIPVRLGQVAEAY